MKIKINYNGEQIEVDSDDVTLPEGVHFISPDNVPEGYFTKAGNEAAIKDRLKRSRQGLKDELRVDEVFQREILEKLNISLDENGNPIGLKPDFDTEEWKRTQIESKTKPFKDEIELLKAQNKTLLQSTVNGEILKVTNGLFKEEYTKSFTGSDDPFVVKQFGSLFGYDAEKGQVALLDGEDFALDGNGQRITPDRYFESNSDKFQSLLADNRQRSSKLDPKIGENRKYTQEVLENMSPEEYAKHRDEIHKKN